ncbi:MAG: hypothetical protein EPN99_07150, partial [Frankiales bacterium]
MSARSTRAAAAGSLALALALALPAAAFADDDRGRDQGSSERAEDRGRSGSAPHGSAGKDRDAREDDKDRDAREDDKDRDREDGEDRKAREDDREAGKDRKAGAAKDGERSEGRPAGKDPRGNNGTVKIDGEAFDDGRGNEPHVGCTFQVDFYGFDAGDTATITFTGHAPTGGGLLHTESRTISTDAAGGGQDRDATFTYSVADQLSELRAVTPHPKQGWHVKLAVDVDSAPGGAKQKVFWIDCPAPAAAAPTTTTTTTTPTTGTTLGAGTTESPAGPVTSQGAGTATVLPAA